MDLPFFGLAREAGLSNGKYYAKGAVSELFVIDTTLPITMSGVCITGMLGATAEEGAPHTLDLHFLKSDGSDVSRELPWGPRQITLELMADGQFGGAFWIGLDGVLIPSLGTYTFSVHADGSPLRESLQLVVKDAPHRANVILYTCIQDSQGKEAGAKYLTGRIQASVIARGRSSNSVMFTVKQTVGADFAVDPMEIGVPKQYSDFLAVPAFRMGLEQFYKRHAVDGLGGTLDGAVDNIQMNSNLIVAPPVLLQLQLPEPSSAGW